MPDLFAKTPSWIYQWISEGRTTKAKQNRRLIASEIVWLASPFTNPDKQEDDGIAAVSTSAVSDKLGLAKSTVYKILSDLWNGSRTEVERKVNRSRTGVWHVNLYTATTTDTPQEESERKSNGSRTEVERKAKCSIIKGVKDLELDQDLETTTPSAKPTLSAAVKNIWEHYLSKRIENNIRGTVSINPARARVIEKTLKIHSENRIKRAISAFLSPSSWHSQNKQYEIAFALRINRDTGADGVERYTPNWEDGREVRPEQDEIEHLRQKCIDWLDENALEGETQTETHERYRGEAAYSNLFHAYEQARDRNR